MVEMHLRDVLVVDQNATFDYLYNARERQANCALTGTCAAYHTYLLPSFAKETQLIQHNFGRWAVPKNH